MSDYQVLCICIALVVIVVVVALTIVLREYVVFLSNRAVSRNEYYYLYNKIEKIEGCLKTLLKKKSEL